MIIKTSYSIGIFIILAALTLELNAQFSSSVNFITNDRYLISQKPDDLAQIFYVLKATRFLPIYSVDGFDDFNSPTFKSMIADMPFKVFPLNYKSPDLVPHDHEGFYFRNGLFKTNRIIPNEINKTSLMVENSPTRVFFQTYFGSETGDPTIHVFTRPENKLINRNKIPYSGLIGISKYSDDYSYKLSAGFFAAYSTGSDNDRMLSYFDNYYFGKINKQFTGNGEFNFNFGDDRKLFIYAGIVSYYGWDLSPFISSFSHFEVINNTLRGSLKNIIKNFSISFRRDEGIGKINKTRITQTSEFSIKEYAIRPSYNFGTSSLTKLAFSGNIFAEVEKVLASNFELDQKIISQEFFKKDINEINYKVGGELYFYQFLFSPSIALEYNRHFSSKNSLSAQFNLILMNGVSLSASSIARYPNVTELYGEYIVNRLINNKIEQFVKSGNPNLTYERLNKIYIEYRYDDIFMNLKAKVFFKNIKNPITQIVGSSKRLFFQYDIINDAKYTNSKNRSGMGIEFSSKLNFSKWLNLGMNYKYLDNKNIQYTPKQKIDINLVTVLPFQARFGIDWIYQSTTNWDDYFVKPENDSYNGNGFNGMLSEVNSVNIYFDYNLINFYIFKSFIMKISFENILNSEMHYHPLGNRFDRAFIFSLSGNI